MTIAAKASAASGCQTAGHASLRRKTASDPGGQVSAAGSRPAPLLDIFNAIGRSLAPFRT
jgi:hypothetical protein